MAHIVSVHSFRGGTGKSNTTANLATVLAAQGRRVGVIDTDIQSPGIHVILGLDAGSIDRSLNDYLFGRCAIEECAYDVTDGVSPDLTGRIYLIPSSTKPGEISRVLKDGYSTNQLARGFRSLVDSLDLDLLLIDTHPGLNEETLLSIVVSHAVLIVFRPDHQDYEGTGITVQVARQLGAARMLLVVNKVPPGLDEEVVRQRVEEAYDCPIAAVIPHDDDIMRLASEAPFVARFPNHPLVATFEKLAAEVMP
jgi:MinD-like ATPase involved in chromosome partitioning or flagellar assembly